MRSDSCFCVCVRIFVESPTDGHAKRAAGRFL